MITKVLKTAAFTGMSLFALSSYAATVTLEGATINYQYDTDTNADALLLFGTPDIVGDVVRFLPPSFRAESVDGAGTATATANFIFENVYTRDNSLAVATIFVREFGDYEITNGDSVSADMQLLITNNNVPFGFLADYDSFDASGPTPAGPPQSWDMSVLIDPELGGLISNSVTVGIQNTLTATTDASGETAWIQKKLAFVAVEEGGTLPPIPIPAAAWLFGSALLGLVGISRKKRA